MRVFQGRFCLLYALWTIPEDLAESPPPQQRKKLNSRVLFNDEAI